MFFTRKGLKTTILATTIAILGTINVVNVNAALLGWDLVDSGKHLDWDSKTVYKSSINSAVSLWEGYRSGVMRPDSIWVIKDVFVSDFYQVSSTLAVTSSLGTIKLNGYHYAGMTSSQRIKTTAHEFGHALGLDHTWGSYDIMQQGKLSITSLSSTDKSSYDAAYKTY